MVQFYYIEVRNLDNINLIIGREELKLQIEKSHNNFIKSDKKILFVKGIAGIGKTYGVTNLLEKYKDIKIIKCKQSKSSIDEFGLLNELINKLFIEILMLSDNEYKPLIYQTKNIIGNDLGYLVNFSDLYYKIYSDVKAKTVKNYSKEKYKVSNAIKKFLKLISNCMSLCVFLDDVQFSNDNSKDVIKAIIKDKMISIFFIISYRSEFKYFLKEEKIYPCIELEPFSEEDIEKIIITNTSKNIQNKKYLVRYIYSITLGNPFYILKAIEELKEKHIIDGDIVHINKLSLSKAFDGIEEIMLSRLNSLSYEENNLLNYMAWLFGELDKNLINVLFDDIEIGSTITSLKAKNFIFETSEKYILAHDIILEYVLSKLDLKSKENINFDIASRLLDKGYDIKHYVHNIIETDIKKWQDDFAYNWFEAVFDLAKSSINNQSYKLANKAVKYIEEAETIIEVDTEIKVSIKLMKIECLYAKVEINEAEEIFTYLLDEYLDSDYLLEIYDKQLEFYRYIGEDTKAIETGKAMLALLGYTYDINETNNLIAELNNDIDLKARLNTYEKNTITPIYVLYKIMPPAKNTSINDFIYIMISMAKISLDDDSSYKIFGLTALSFVMFYMFDDYEKVKYYSDIILANIDGVEDEELRIETYSFYLTFVHHWSNDILDTTKLLETVNNECLENGYIPHFSYTLSSMLFAYSNIGKNIDESINIIKQRTLDLTDITLAENSYISTYVNIIATSYENAMKEESFATANCEELQSKDLVSIWFEILGLFLKNKVDKAYSKITLVTKMFDEAKGHIVYTDINFISALIRIMHHNNITSDDEKNTNLNEIDRILNFFKTVTDNYKENHISRYLFMKAIYENQFGNRYLSLGMINEGIGLAKGKNNSLLIAIGNLLAIKINEENTLLAQFYKKEAVKYLEILGAKAIKNIYDDSEMIAENIIKDISLMDKDEFCKYLLDTLNESYKSSYSAIITLNEADEYIAFENNGQTKVHIKPILIKYNKIIKKELINYVVRTKEEIISKNEDMLTKCIPLTYKGEVIAVIYLDHKEKYDKDILKFINNHRNELISRLHDKTSEKIDDLSEILTFREIEILKLLSKGKTNNEISESENISIGTVKAHLSSIYGKLEVNSRLKAVDKAKELRII